MRSYDGLTVPEKVGTFNVTIDCSDGSKTGKAAFTPDKSYANRIPQYGLPIGKYTLANEKTSFGSTDEGLPNLLEKCFKFKTNTEGIAEAVDIIEKYYGGFTGYSEISTVSATYSDPEKADLAAEHSTSAIYLGWDGTQKIGGLNTEEYLMHRLGMFLIKGDVDTGEVTITKNVSDPTNTAKEVYAFTLTQSEGALEKISGTYPADGTLIDEKGDPISGVTFTNGVAKVYLKDKNSITISGIPAGIEFTIAEDTENLDYTYDTEILDETVTIDKDNPAKVTVINTVQIGSLTISKEVTGNGADNTKEFTFTVNFTAPHKLGEEKTALTGSYKYVGKNGASSGTIELENGSGSFKLKDGQSITIEDLPIGTTYTVTEKEANKGGYITRDSDGNVIDKFTGEISETNSQAAFENYKPAPTTTAIEITKAISGSVPEGSSETFKFSVVEVDEKDNEKVGGTRKSANITGAGKESVTLNYTAAGTYYYRVTEDNVDNTHYTKDDTVYTVTVKVEDIGGQLEVTEKTIEKHGESGPAKTKVDEIVFTNTYTPDLVPEVTIAKKQSVGDGEKTTDTLEVKPNNIVTYYLTITNTVEGSTATNVVVTDVIPSGLTLVDGSITPNSGQISGETITWIIDKLEYGNPVELRFKVKVPATAQEQTWKNTATVNYPNTTDPKNPNEDTSNTVVIEETVDPKVEVKKTQSVGDALKTTGILEVNPGDTVTYFLTVTASGGSDGTVAKNIKVTDKIPEGLKFVDGSITNGNLAEGIITSTIANDTVTWTIAELANGGSVVLSFKVTVPEVGEDPVSKTTRSWKNIAMYNDGKDKTDEVTVTENLGNLKISKRVSGNDGDRTEPFKFTLNIYTDSSMTERVAISDTATFAITDSDNQPVGSAGFVTGECVFELKHGQSLTVNGLPAGAYFEVKEIDSGEGYDTTATGTLRKDDDGNVISCGTIAENSTVTASFTNYRHKAVQTGSLTVRKTVASPNIDPDADYTFGFTLTLPQFSEETSFSYRITDLYGEFVRSGILPASGTFSLKHGQEIVISGIPVNTEYEVWEDPVPVGYILSTYNDIGIINADETGTVKNQTAVFVNTEDILGSLTVSKTVIGSEATPWSFFEFVVTLYNDAEMTDVATDISGEYGSMYFENGVAVLSLVDGDSCTAIGLPDNLYYTVVERDNYEGYTPELALPVGQTPASLFMFNTPSVFDAPPVPGDTVILDDPVTPDEPATDEPVISDEPITSGEPITTDEPIPLDEMPGEPVTSESDIVSNGTTAAAGQVLPDEMPPDGMIPFGLPMPIDNPAEPAYGPTVTGAITPTATGTVSFVNTKNVDIKTGDIVIEKQVGGHGDREYEFCFKVEFFTDATAETHADIYAVVIKDTPDAETEGEDFVEITAGVGEFSLKDGESICVGGIPVGTYFTVTETDPAGHTVSVTGDHLTFDDVTLTANGTIVSDDSVHVIFHNDIPETHVVPVDTALEIEKSFNETGATALGNLTFDFTVTDTTKEPNVSKTEHVTVYMGKESGISHSITLSFPEAGTYTYSVSEEHLSEDVGEYEGTIDTVTEPVEVIITVAAKDDGTLYIESAKIDGKEAEDPESLKVSFENTYIPPEPETSKIVLTKKVIDENGAEISEGSFKFTVTLTNCEDYSKEGFDGGKITVDLEAGSSVTLTVPVGAEYVIEEIAIPDGYTDVTGKTSGTADEDINIEYTNKKDPETEPETELGALTLKKVLIVNNSIVTGGREFTFRIELVGEDFTGNAGGVEFKNGVAEVTLSGGDSVTMTGLPVGAEYIITESSTQGYRLVEGQSIGLSGKIVADKEATAVAVNMAIPQRPNDPYRPPVIPPDEPEPTSTPEVTPPTEAGIVEEDRMQNPETGLGFGGILGFLSALAAMFTRKNRK